MNTLLLSMVCVFLAVTIDIVIWTVQDRVIQKLNDFEEKNTNTKKNFLSDFVIRMNVFFKKKTESMKKSINLDQHTETPIGKFFMFIFAVFCFLPVFPDILVIRALRKRISFPNFVIAAVL